MKHPKFRVSDWLKVREDVRRETENVFLSSESFLPFEVADFEIAGSYAFGNAKLYSDLDVNIACRDWNTQIPAHRIFRSDDSAVLKFKKVIHEYSQTWGLKIDVAPVDCDSKRYNCVYSIKEQKLYGRNHDEILSIHLQWDGYAWMWKKVPELPRSTLWEVDPWTEECPEWAKAYGDCFQTPKMVLQG